MQHILKKIEEILSIRENQIEFSIGSTATRDEINLQTIKIITNLLKSNFNMENQKKDYLTIEEVNKIKQAKAEKKQRKAVVRFWTSIILNFCQAAGLIYCIYQLSEIWDYDKDQIIITPMVLFYIVVLFVCSRFSLKIK